MRLVPSALVRRANQVGAVAQNAMEVVLLGGLETGDEPAPFRVVSDQRVYRLRHYFPDAGTLRVDDGEGETEDDRPVLLLVPPMMLATEVYDVSPQASAVTELHRLGLDPWVVDFGAPEREEGGLERTLTDHVLAVDDAITRVRAATGRNVHLVGYSQGGMFCYQAAAYRRSRHIASIITFGSPVDFSATLPFGIPEQLAGPLAAFLADNVFANRALPAWASSTAFRMLDPIKDVRQRIDFLMQLGDREALLPRERQRRFLQGEGFVAWSGPILADVLRNFVVHNRMLSGGFVIEERLVTLADITCPVLAFVGEYDQIAMPDAVRAITRAAPRAWIYERTVKAGHFGMVVGSAAGAESWPAVLGWTRWVGSGADPEAPPPGAAPMEDREQTLGGSPSVGASLELAANAGIGTLRSIARSVRSSTRGVLGVATEAVAQLPRLFRLEQIEANTRISLGRLLDEHAQRAPDDVLFLFADRAHTHAATKHRIDSIVRGLISVGVRQGQHVGVLMDPRPSGLSSVAALSRLGAVSVLMRPDGDHVREAAIGGVDFVLTDPEHGARLAAELDVPVLVLGGGADPRDLGPGVIDLERVDPDAVELPGWYRPNPGRAADLGFVVFSGEGGDLRAKRITNHRWALSAFGTATAGALSPADTVYMVTPLHHPAGLLTALGGAVAGGSRIALARRFDAGTFWDEVRRYGVTTVAYTWTLLRELTEAPVDPAEHHHPVRQFIGSGMPRGLWLRVLERFGSSGGAADRTARVLEFYASTEGDAVLANVSRSRPGAKGRRLPGSAEVRLAAWDPEAGRLVEGPDGFVLPAAEGEIGMLLSRVRSAVEAAPGTAVRGVFAPGDAWHVTGDLFRTDEHGDWWLVDHAQATIRTAHGVVYAFPVQDALGDLPAIDLSVVYPLERASADSGSARHVAVAAVTLRADQDLSALDITAALDALDPDQRPDLVHVVDEIPLTTWYRPTTGPLRAAGLPKIHRPARAWTLDAERRRYVPLTAALRDRLR
jgi:putative long chain acyl-CoA synthase